MVRAAIHHDKKHNATSKKFDDDSSQGSDLMPSESEDVVSQTSSQTRMSQKIPNRDEIHKASMLLAQKTGKAKKPFGDTQMWRDIMVTALKCMGNTEGARDLKLIPCSRNTVTRNILKLSLEKEELIKEKIQNCAAMSIALDETTDGTSELQLIVFVRCVNEDFTVFEDLLDLTQLEENSTGEDIFEKLIFMLDKFNMIDVKLFSTTTDGAGAMIGPKKGLQGQMGKVFDTLHFHCIIHVQVLAAQSLMKTPVLKNAMNMATKIINALKGGHHSLTHRRLKLFLKQNEAEFTDILLYTEVRWLSRGKSITRFFALREELTRFLDTLQIRNIDEMKSAVHSSAFWDKIAFISDMAMSMNVLNLSLQGNNKDIFSLLKKIDNYINQLKEMSEDYKTGTYNYFPACKKISSPFVETFLTAIDDMAKVFESRFKDFDNIRDVIRLYPDFPEILPETDDVNREVLQQYLSVFPTTYRCESAFSSLTHIKNKKRRSISSLNLAASMRLALSNEESESDESEEEHEE